jgi:hypothetical protein
MKSRRGILAAAFCVLPAMPAMPALAAVEIVEAVGHLSGATPLEECDWESQVVQSSVMKSRNFVVMASASSSASGQRLSLHVVRLKLSRAAKKSDYSVVIRADVADADRLVATREFQEDASFDNGRSGCDSLRTVGASLGEAVAGWVAETRFMKCGVDCDGIHPDESIVIGAQVLIGEADAINDTVRNDCRFATAMVDLLVKTFNEYDPAPRAKLESRAIDVQQYSGRRLLLRVHNVHALGGGGWTGPKWMDMSGELWDGKSLVGNFYAHTSSGRGLTTCRSVDSLSESAAYKIVEWLRNPTLGASLN